MQAYYDEDGNLCVHCKTMTLYFDRDDMAEAIGIPVENLRVIENPTGGSFGWAMSAHTYSMVGIATKVTGMPCSLSHGLRSVHGRIRKAFSGLLQREELACDEGR